MATGRGTLAFLDTLVHASNIRSMGALRVSGVGFGGYRIEEANPVHSEALERSVLSGVNLIDTSPSYGNGGSERLIGSVLEELLNKDKISRENVVVCTKVGYIEGSELETVKDNPPPECLKLSDDSWHCIHPDFIRRQIRGSIERLKTVPDVVLLHSPEFFMTSAEGVMGGPGGQKRSIEELHEAFYERVERAFVCMEEMISEGLIGHYYGSSSSLQGCDYSVTGRPNFFEGPSLRKLLQTAEKAASTASTNASCENNEWDSHSAIGHRMRVMQIPLNIVESGPVLQQLFDPDAPSEVEGGEKGRFVSALEVAHSKGICVLGNRPVNAIPPEGIGAGDWGRGETFWKLVDKKPISPELALIRDAILSSLHLDETVDYGNMTSHQRLALWLASNANGIGAELCGCRDPKYVEDVQTVLSTPRLRADICKDAFASVRNQLILLSPKHAELW